MKEHFLFVPQIVVAKGSFLGCEFLVVVFFVTEVALKFDKFAFMTLKDQ